MSMPSEQAKAVFLEATEGHPPEAWPAFLDRACAGDPGLRGAVERLLRARAELGSFHEAAGAQLGPTVDAPPGEQPGTVIGPYKLLEQIGEGGFGTVFMAEQSQPVRRKVALKVLKPGMDTRQVVARFEAERQALAIMDHPNIAKVFDGGATPAGRPYFVMELVKGMPVTEFCDSNHLTPRQRLELFVSVCQAVQHAHQKGIIHRDLKPSNVLVTVHDTAPVVKVIDFGVAKALGQELTDKTLFTGFAQMIGTPLYMSPEQAGQSGLDVDTRSDIYSLGVLLYELLTGSTPFAKERFKQAAYDEIRRIIREEEPPKPSTRLSDSTASLPSISARRQTEPGKLTRLFRGEVDWIVMKALEKDRNRRYETANAFASDVQRYLAGEAVYAVPPSARYRFRKFARRNKAAFAAGSAAALVVLLGMVGLAVNNRLVTREKERAVREKERGDRHLARAKKAVEDFFAHTAQDRRLKAAGLHDLRTALLTSMVAFLEDFVHQEGGGRPLQVERAWAFFNLAKIWAEVGETVKALAQYARAREAWAALVAEAPDTEGSRSFLADCDHNRGVLLRQANRLDEAEEALRQALAVRNQLAEEFPRVASHRSGLGSVLRELSLVARERNDKEGARRLLEEAIVHHKAAVRADARDREALGLLADRQDNLGVVLLESGRPAESEAAHTEALAVFEGLLAALPGDPEARAGVAGCHLNLGNLYSRGRPAEAVKAYRRAVAVLDPLAAQFPGVPEHRRHMAGGYHNLGTELALAGQGEDAEAAFDTGSALREQLVKEHPGDLDYALESATSLIGRGLRAADAARFDDALGSLTRAIAVLEPLVAPGQRGSEAACQLVNASGARGEVLLRLGRHADAVKEYDRALGLDDGKNRTHSRLQRALALAHLKEHVRATAEAEAVVAAPDLPAYLVQDAAGVHAVCSAAVAGDVELSERYAVRAVALLRRAFEKNFRAIAGDVRGDKNLAALRPRDDYRKLVSEWEAKQKK